MIEATLKGSNLQESNLTGADLRRTHLQGSNLDRAKLRGANLRGAIWVNGVKCLNRDGSLRVNLRFLFAGIAASVFLGMLGFAIARSRAYAFYRLDSATRCPVCNLRESDLSSRDLRGANLNSADLRGANLSRVDLSDADLRGATV